MTDDRGERTRRIADLVEVFLEARRRDPAITVQSFCDEHPAGLREELARECEGALEVEAVLDGWEAGDRGEDDGGAWPGRTVGDFKVKRRLGVGGMGEVFLAQQLSVDRDVALKIMLPSYVGIPVAEMRFRKEGQVLAALDHESIVKVVGAGSSDGALYYAMDHIAGPSLGAEITRLRALARGPSRGSDPAALDARYGPRFAAEVVAQVARALHHAHRRGFIHRDVKPQNILLREGDGLPILIDFGLAKLVPEAALDDQPPLTRDDQIPGTVEYMSPEQARGIKLDGRTDVYSLGVVLYQLLTLSLPYTGETPELVRRRVLTRRLQPVRRTNAKVPRDLALICEKSLEKDREHRYENAAQFAADLEAFLDHRSTLARPLRLDERASRFLSRNRRGLLVAAGIAVAAFALLALWRALEARGTADDTRPVLERFLAEEGEIDSWSTGDLEEMVRARDRLGEEPGWALRGTDNELLGRVDRARLRAAEAAAGRARSTTREACGDRTKPVDPSSLFAGLEDFRRAALLDPSQPILNIDDFHPDVSIDTARDGCEIFAKRLGHDSLPVEASRSLGRSPWRGRLEPGYYRFTMVAPNGDYAELSEDLGDLGQRYSIEMPTILSPADARRDMTLVEGGVVEFGVSNPENLDARRRVEVAPFLIDPTEVSNAQYIAYLDARAIRRPEHLRPPDYDAARHANLPACGISFADATGYARFRGKRLPTRPEWEFAAAGTGGARRYPWGDDGENLAQRAVVARPGSVGKFIEASRALVSVEDENFRHGPYRLFHILGNVREWTETMPLSRSGQVAIIDRSSRIVKGAAWTTSLENAELAAKSHAPVAGPVLFGVGFRCALGLR